jgi:hypothetical protein
MNFGEPHVEVSPARIMPLHIDGAPARAMRRSAHVRGDWHLWIYQCAWTLALSGITLAHSESDQATIRRALRALNGQALIRVQIDPDEGRTEFAFDLGCDLTAFQYPEHDGDEPDELWMLFEPSGQVVTTRSDGTISRTPSAEPRDHNQWLAITEPMVIELHP